MRKTTTGFTIIEILVVIAVIGILTTIGLLSFNRYQASTRDAQRSAKTVILAEALEKYYDNNGEYPSCGTMSGAATTLTTTVLPGIDPAVLLTPKSAAGATNSISCTDLTGANSEPDSFAYIGDSSTDCVGGQACLQWTLKYREEATGNIISISSRRQVNLATSGVPVLNATPAGFSQVNLNWSAVTNAESYIVQYATDNTFSTGIIAQSTPNTSRSITGLTTGTTYYFRVQAVNGSSAGNWSNIKSVVVNFTNINWSERTAPGLDYWTGLASSADGNKLVAGTTYNGGRVNTSTDAGATWIERTGAGSRAWGNLASSSDGTKLVAGVVNESIFTSTNSGATWTARPTSGVGQWWGVASSDDGVKLVASMAANYPETGNYIYTSTDSGVNWIQRISSGSHDWRSVASSADGTKLTAVAMQGYIYSSTDSGATWVQRTSAGARNWWNVKSSADGVKLIASASVNNYIYTSADSGVTWVARTGPGLQNWRQVASSADGTKLAAGAWGGYIYTSVDSGATWVTQTSAGSRFWMVLDSSDDGTKIVAGVSSLGYLYNGVYGP